jgi:dimethylargininase
LLIIMIFTHAITRRPIEKMAAGISTSRLGPPNHKKALDQFDAYVETLNHIGLSVTVLDPLEGYPDAHFVEDAAVVTPDVAVITNPGAASRKGEVQSIAAALHHFRKTVWIQPPGTIDGGDVLMAGDHFFIGLSDRTNEQGAWQLGNAVSAFGCTWTPVPVADGLHLKSSVNAVGANTLLLTRPFNDHPAFAGFHRIVISPHEAYAGNTLLVNNHLIMPAGFPETKLKLKGLVMPIIELEMSEFRKMDGGLTCLSLRF